MNLPVDLPHPHGRAALQAALGPSVLAHFAHLHDPRMRGRITHNLIDIVIIALFGIISDCNDWVAVEDYGTDKQAWLRTFLELPNGIPSHDTFTRIFRRLEPRPFQLCFRNWLSAISQQLQAQQSQPAQAEREPVPPTPDQPVSQPEQPQPEPPQFEQQQSEQPQPEQKQSEQGQTSQPEAEQPQAEQEPQNQPGPEPAQQEVPQVEQAQDEAAVPGRHLAVDGKALRHSFDKAAGLTALHLVSVWACERRPSLGQVAVAGKSNEITAIPRVLGLVDLEGALVSIDAIGTQEDIARQTREGKGYYLPAVKANQPRLFEDVVETFTCHFDRLKGKADPCELTTVDDDSHGRVEKRTYVVINDVSKIRDKEKWPGVKRLIMVHRECQYASGKFEEETRYFICGAGGTVGQCAQWVRDHWLIENQLHWVLDVAFTEDACRVRKGHGAENMAWLRRIAVSLLGNETSFKGSFAHKRKKAARNNDYLLRVLGGFDDSDDLE